MCVSVTCAVTAFIIRFIVFLISTNSLGEKHYLKRAFFLKIIIPQMLAPSVKTYSLHVNCSSHFRYA